MSTTLSRKERKIKFKSLAFAALQKSTGNETICVQVGAHDGKRWDPVFGHITQNGSNALVIEPHPIFFERFSENYVDHPNVTPVNLAVSDVENDFMLFHVAQNAAGKYPKWLQGCASVHVSRMDDSIETACRLSGHGVKLAIWLPQRSMQKSSIAFCQRIITIASISSSSMLKDINSLY